MSIRRSRLRFVIIIIIIIIIIIKSTVEYILKGFFHLKMNNVIATAKLTLIAIIIIINLGFYP